jgi:hypothetical protein
LIDGKVSKPITTTEKISSTMKNKMKCHTAKEGKESQDKPLLMKRLSITTKEDDDLHG